jgi:hypothetical protein
VVPWWQASGGAVMTNAGSVLWWFCERIFSKLWGWAPQPRLFIRVSYVLSELFGLDGRDETFIGADDHPYRLIRWRSCGLRRQIWLIACSFVLEVASFAIRTHDDGDLIGGVAWRGRGRRSPCDLASLGSPRHQPKWHPRTRRSIEGERHGESPRAMCGCDRLFGVGGMRRAQQRHTASWRVHREHQPEGRGFGSDVTEAVAAPGECCSPLMRSGWPAHNRRLRRGRSGIYAQPRWSFSRVILSQCTVLCTAAKLPDEQHPEVLLPMAPLLHAPRPRPPPTPAATAAQGRHNNGDLRATNRHAGRTPGPPTVTIARAPREPLR